MARLVVQSGHVGTALSMFNGLASESGDAEEEAGPVAFSISRNWGDDGEDEAVVRDALLLQGYEMLLRFLHFYTQGGIIHELHMYVLICLGLPGRAWFLVLSRFFQFLVAAIGIIYDMFKI